MNERSEVRRRLISSQKAAKAHISAIREAAPLEYSFLKQELKLFILAKFLLSEDEIGEDELFDSIVEKSLSHSMKIDPKLVEEFDTAKSCNGVTSAMAKKVLLFMAIERELNIQLPALETARVKTLDDVARMVYKATQVEDRK